MPKCKQCRDSHDKEEMQQVGIAMVCRKDACIAGESLKLYDKQLAAKKRATTKAKKVASEGQKKKDRAWVEANESLSSVCSRVQKDVNKLYMVMDAGKPCISCGGAISEAGHYYHASEINKYIVKILRL